MWPAQRFHSCRTNSFVLCQYAYDILTDNNAALLGLS